jgi:hypothetical protein
LLLRLAKDLAAGRAPKSAYDHSVYNVRPVTVLLPETVPVMEGAAGSLQAGSGLQKEAVVS